MMFTEEESSNSANSLTVILLGMVALSLLIDVVSAPFFPDVTGS